MRRNALAVSLSVVLALSACSQDLTQTGPVKDRPALSTTGGACTEAQSVDYLKKSIDSLMKVLTPNNSSAQSKFQTILNALDAGDVATAQSELQTLINFINLKYGQANTTNVFIQDPATGQYVAIEEFKNNLIDQLTCYVALNSFDLNEGDPDKVFSNPDNSAGVFFPAGYVPRGFNVAITTPAAEALITNLDKYPSFIDIQLLDEDGNEPAPGTVFTGQPIVVVCFPAGLSPEVAQRSLLGHQASSGFELLPEVAVPQMLADAVSCGDGLNVQTNVIGRLIRKAADFLLPQKLHARFFGLGGVGGSPEEFSPFGAVDPGLAFGGAGGSPEEFIRASVKASAPRAPITAILAGDGTVVQGIAGSPDLTDTGTLPKVRIATPSGTGFDGVVVTFTLSAPDASGNDGISGPESQATICGGTSTTTVEVTTANGGYAQVPCLNFGTLIGYKNLKATFDPDDVEPLACILDSAGNCAPATTSVNFLVETTLAAAALAVVPTTPPIDNTTVGTAVEELTATVADQFGNPYVGNSVSVSGTGIACVGGGTACLSGTTDANGRVFFNGLTNTTAGTTELTFVSGLLSANVNVTFVAGAAAKIVLVPPPAGGSYGTGLTAFSTLSQDPTVKTTDTYDNPVSASVFWQLVSTATGAAISPAGPWTSNAGGIASVDWTLGDGSNGLTAYLGTAAGGPSVAFTASTAAVTTTNLAACFVSGSIKKTDLAKFVSTGYKGYFSFPSKAKGLIRTANINMSVTGQSSGTGNYPTTLRAYRKVGSGLGDLIATGQPTTSDQTLKLPGSNSSPTAVPFAMTPNTLVPSVVAVGETIIFELSITAPSTRTFQVWYNTKNTVGTDCYNTVLYTPTLVTPPNFSTSSFQRGLHLRVTN